MTDIDYKVLDPMVKQFKNLAENAVKRRLNGDEYALSEDEKVAIALLAGLQVDSNVDKENPCKVHIVIDNVSIQWDGTRFLVFQRGQHNEQNITKTYGSPAVN